MGPLQYSECSGDGQEASGVGRRFRPRRCLLRGCERWYRPTHPQSRYCREACREEARRWRRRQSSRRWRASEAGKVRRREQCRRSRRRIPLDVIAAPVVEPVPERREGQRPAKIPDDFWIEPCQRPGCYAMFVVRPHSAWRRFCCGLCRQALRRVLDREARYRRRRRAGDSAALAATATATGVLPRRRQSVATEIRGSVYVRFPPNRRRQRAGPVDRPPVPSSDGWVMGGWRRARLGDRRGQTAAARRNWVSDIGVIGWPTRRPRKRWPVAARYGQLSPVTACRRDGRAELLDGFKRRSAAAQVVCGRR